MRLIRIRDGKVLSRERPSAPLCATIGNFDGVHRGHQSLLNTVIAYKKADPKLETVVITFSPHPSLVLGKTQSLPELTPLREKLRVMENLGIDWFVNISFTKKLSELSWDTFLESNLLRIFDLKFFILGPDARIGKKGEGTIDKIAPYLFEKKVSVFQVNYIQSSTSEKVSSRQIRELVTSGDLEEVESHLGRPYKILGKVVSGDGRGRTIGFPTANMDVKNQLIPKNGVYAGIVELEGSSKKFKAVANIGNRPTFNGLDRRIEVHLLHYGDKNFRGKKMTFTCLAYLREEKKFPTTEELIIQIKQDCQRGDTFLSALPATRF